MKQPETIEEAKAAGNPTGYKSPPTVVKAFLWLLANGVMLFGRVFKILLRTRLFPNLFKLEADLFLAESVDPAKARNEAPEFMRRMHSLYPEFFKEGLTQMALWFQEADPPNFLGFKTLDPATGNILEVMVRRVDGLTEHDINQRYKLALQTIAAMPESPLADVERLRDVAKRTLAACGWKSGEVLLPVDEVRDSYGELYAFNILYNIWLEADLNRRRRAELARKVEGMKPL